MRILLHIGQSKTGTSAIQAYLTLNRKQLREGKVLYPGVTIKNMPLEYGNHNTLADALVGHIHYPFLTADQYFAQFFEQASKCDAELMILSAEHFFGGEPRIWDVRDESTYFAGYQNKIEALSSYLRGHDVSLLLYLRSQVDWLSSAISQTIRVEKLMTDKAVYENDCQSFEMFKPLLQYTRLLKIWEDALQPNRVIVVPYDRNLLYRHSSIADFLHRVGLDHLDLPFSNEGMQVNQSLSREYIEVKKILNRTPKSENEERVIITCLEYLSAQNKMPVPYYLEDELVKQVEKFVLTENIKLNERYSTEGEIFKAKSNAFPEKEKQVISTNAVEMAMSAFKKEFWKPRIQFLKIDYFLRALLREYARPLHSALHQLRRIKWKFIYRN